MRPDPKPWYYFVRTWIIASGIVAVWIIHAISPTPTCIRWDKENMTLLFGEACVQVRLAEIESKNPMRKVKRIWQ